MAKDLVALSLAAVTARTWCLGFGSRGWRPTCEMKDGRNRPRRAMPHLHLDPSPGICLMPSAHRITPLSFFTVRRSLAGKQTFSTGCVEIVLKKTITGSH